jgi:hypothetical protein
LNVLLATTILLGAWLFTLQQAPAFFQQVAVDKAKSGAMSGTIVGPEPNSAAGILVSASLQEPDPGFSIKTFTARSDDKGHFEFRSLPIGSYQLEVLPKDKWLFKQTVMPVTVRDSQRTTIDVRFQFIDQCEGKKAEELTSADKAAIIKFMLEEAVTRKKIPSYPHLVSDRRVILSTKNIEASQTFDVPGFELLLLSASEIQARANRRGDLMYLEFNQIEIRGSCVAVSLWNLWADGTSTIETGPKVLMGEASMNYVFYKRAGTWTGEFVTGSFS